MPLFDQSNSPQMRNLASADKNMPRNGTRFKVLAYQRVSVHEDQTGSHTFETQNQRIREKLDVLYGAGNYDYREITDNGLSGAYGLVPTPVQRKTRRSLKVIADELLKGNYDCFIVYSLNRFMRSPRWFHQFLEDVIIPSGVDFVSATQDLQLGNAEGRAMAGMLSILDGLFRDSVVQRNKDAARTRAEGGYYVGMIGYGWQWEPIADIPPNGRRRIIPNLEQKPWVLQIKDWYLSGWSLPRIAGELNNRGVSSPSGKSRWTTSVVHKVLHNPVHAGLVPLGRGGKNWLVGEHVRHRFLAPEELEQIRSAAQKRAKWKTNTQRAPQHLLNGLAYCQRCGNRLYVSSANSPYRSYRCENGTWQGQRSCPDLTIRADELEQAVVRYLEQLSAAPSMRELLAEEAVQLLKEEENNTAFQQRQLQDQLKALKTRFEKWAELFSRGILTEEQFIGYKDTLAQEQTDIECRLRQFEESMLHRRQQEADSARVREYLCDFSAIWENLDQEERRQVLVYLLESLTVDRFGRDALVKIKVPLLPEQKIPIMFRTTVNMKEKPTGLQSLTPRQLAYLYHVGQGKNRREIAAIMGVHYSSLTTHSLEIRKRLQVKNEKEAAALAAERIAAVLPTLPLGQPVKSEQADSKTPLLSPALMEVLPYIVQGASNSEASHRLGLPVTTVAGRRARIMDILGAHTAFGVAEKAQELGLLAQNRM
jgi:site-specific DNA recombinase